MMGNFVFVTILTYFCMVLYCAAIGWTIGEGVEHQYGDVDDTTRRKIAIDSSRFFILNAKWVLLLAPAIFVSWLTAPDNPLMFVYAYSSCMLLQMFTSWITSKLKKRLDK